MSAPASAAARPALLELRRAVKRHRGRAVLGPVDLSVARVAELARLPADLLGRYPAQLSGGQAQRVALVRALVLDPEVLLLDEPLGALDPVTRADLQDDLAAAFARLGKTVVLVTHDLAEAALLGGRIAVLREGLVVQEGTIEDLARRPADPFVTRFVRAQRSPLDSLRERT